jgi:ParB family chromosome partitioning protein
MRRALGKGLSQLIADQYDGSPSEVPIEAIVPNALQPRVHFEPGPLEELSRSIKEHGILQPVAVRPIADGQYELIAGERRLRAAKLAGLRTIPVIIRAATNENSLELALIENIQREDINALECARAYRRLVDDFGLTQEQVADKVGKSRVAITNTLRLLKLPRRIQEAVSSGKISGAHARALLGFESEAHQLAVFDQIISNNLTVKAVEQKSKEVSTRPRSSARPQKQLTDSDPNSSALEEALSTYFGTPVKIDRTSVDGTLGIKFYSDDDLERILEILGFRL